MNFLSPGVAARGALVLLMACLMETPASAQDARPTVKIYATGGTIAGVSKSSSDTSHYKSGALDVETLINAVPRLKDIADVSGEQIANVSSSNVTSDILLKLANSINKELHRPEVSGAVVTHGTDTLEETAFFLDLTVQSNKPVVVVGAMRPATAISADGPFNLLQAVALAACGEAKDRGVMIVMNDRIGSAFYTTKTNTTAVDTFRAVEQGYLGMFVGEKPHFYYTPALPTHKPKFDVSKVKAFPKVSIIYMHEDQDPGQLDAAIKAGAEGIVVAGSGNGAMPASVKQRVGELTEKGYPIILSTRTGGGLTIPKRGIGSGSLNPQKARILLMLALAQHADTDTLRRYFNE